MNGRTAAGLTDAVSPTDELQASTRYHRRVADESAQPLEQQLEEIRTQLAWVRDYL
jgi:hypothetical protein